MTYALEELPMRQLKGNLSISYIPAPVMFCTWDCIFTLLSINCDTIEPLEIHTLECMLRLLDSADSGKLNL